MGSEFKKLIESVFGKAVYKRYATFARNNIRRESEESRNISNDLNRVLKTVDRSVLTSMHEELTEVMVSVVRLKKKYIFASLTCLAAIAALAILDLTPFVTTIAIILVALAYAYKTYEFLVNKFCFVDAKIILVYKSVLEKLIGTPEENQPSEQQ